MPDGISYLKSCCVASNKKLLPGGMPDFFLPDSAYCAGEMVALTIFHRKKANIHEKTG